MTWRSKLALAGIGAVGSAINKSLAESGGSISPGVLGAQETYRWRGQDIAYTETGPEDGPEVVCLHDVDVAGSSFEFRELVAELSETYRVIIPDLPGFGRSDRPKLKYSATLYQSFLQSFLEDVTDQPYIIASGTTASYAANIVTQDTAEQLTLIEPADYTVARSATMLMLLRSPVIGTAMHNFITSKVGLSWIGRKDFYSDVQANSDILDYRWKTAHQPGSRFVTAARLTGYLDPEERLESILADVTVPTTLLWGRESTTESLKRGRTLANEADCRLIVLDDTRRRPHMEYPADVAGALVERIPEFGTP